MDSYWTSSDRVSLSECLARFVVVFLDPKLNNFFIFFAGYTPNRVHLLGVDFLIAGIQFLLVIIAFGNGSEGHRSLLGDDEESFSDDEEEVQRK